MTAHGLTNSPCSVVYKMITYVTFRVLEIDCSN